MLLVYMLWSRVYSVCTDAVTGVQRETPTPETLSVVSPIPAVQAAPAAGQTSHHLTVKQKGLGRPLGTPPLRFLSPLGFGEN